MLNSKLERAALTAAEIDRLIGDLDGQLKEIVPELQRDKRPHHSGMIIAFGMNLRNAFYAKVASELRNMRD